MYAHKSTQWRSHNPARWTKCVGCVRRELGVCEWICDATQRTGRRSEMLLTEHDRKWLKAIDQRLPEGGQHA